MKMEFEDGDAIRGSALADTLWEVVRQMDLPGEERTGFKKA